MAKVSQLMRTQGWGSKEYNNRELFANVVKHCSSSILLSISWLRHTYQKWNKRNSSKGILNMFIVNVARSFIVIIWRDIS